MQKCCYETLSKKNFIKVLDTSIFYKSFFNFTDHISSYRKTPFNINDFISENNNNFNQLNYHILKNKKDIIGFCSTEKLMNDTIYLSSYIVNTFYRGMCYNNFFMKKITNNLKLNYHKIELKVHEDNIKALNSYLSNDYFIINKENKRYIMNKILR